MGFPEGICDRVQLIDFFLMNIRGAPKPFGDGTRSIANWNGETSKPAELPVGSKHSIFGFENISRGIRSRRVTNFSSPEGSLKSTGTKIRSPLKACPRFRTSFSKVTGPSKSRRCKIHQFASRLPKTLGVTFIYKLVAVCGL